MMVIGILAASLYGSFVWNPLASLIIASVSALLFSGFIFDKDFVTWVANTDGDRLSLLLGAGISYIGVIASVVALVA